MKKLLLTTLTFFAVMTNVIAADLQQQLEEARKLGLVVRMGELTGAGGRLSLKKVHAFVHPEGLIQKSACISIAVKAGSDQTNPKVSDVSVLTLAGEHISAQEIIGIVSVE